MDSNMGGMQEADTDNLSVEDAHETIADEDERKSLLSDEEVLLAQTPSVISDLSQMGTPSTESAMDEDKETVMQLLGSEDSASGLPADADLHRIVHSNASAALPADASNSLPGPQIVYRSKWTDYLYSRISIHEYPIQKDVAADRAAHFATSQIDHSYTVKSGNGQTDHRHPLLSNVKTLFNSLQTQKVIAEGTSLEEDSKGALEIVRSDRYQLTDYPYDRDRAFQVMREMEEFLGVIQPTPAEGAEQVKFDEEFYKTFSRRGNWTARQRQFFDSCMKILCNERCTRLSVAEHPDEPIIRRLMLDRTASKFRKMMANIQWNGRLVYWLHSVLVEGLSVPLLSIYFEILQTLVEKIPEHIKSLFNYMLPTPAPGPDMDFLLKMLEHPWNPIDNSIYEFGSLPKFSQQPLFVIAPHPYGSETETDHISYARIRAIWQFFRNMGQVVQIECPSTADFTPKDLYTNMLISTRNTLADLRKVHPDVSLVLVGVGIGAMIACQTSLIEPCSAIVCFGFPLKTPKGFHGFHGDPLFKLDAPTQFIIGTQASDCPIPEFLEFREKLKCPTSVVLASGCDEYLRMKSFGKLSLKMTQSMVDRCFMEEIIPFIHSALQRARPSRPLPSVAESKKRKAKTGPPATKKPRAETSRVSTRSKKAQQAAMSAQEHQIESDNSMPMPVDSPAVVKRKLPSFTKKQADQRNAHTDPIGDSVHNGSPEILPPARTPCVRRLSFPEKPRSSVITHTEIHREHEQMVLSNAGLAQGPSGEW